MSKKYECILNKNVLIFDFVEFLITNYNENNIRINYHYIFKNLQIYSNTSRTQFKNKNDIHHVLFKLALTTDLDKDVWDCEEGIHVQVYDDILDDLINEFGGYKLVDNTFTLHNIDKFNKYDAILDSKEYIFKKELFDKFGNNFENVNYIFNLCKQFFKEE